MICPTTCDFKIQRFIFKLLALKRVRSFFFCGVYIVFKQSTYMHSLETRSFQVSSHLRMWQNLRRIANRTSEMILDWRGRCYNTPLSENFPELVREKNGSLAPGQLQMMLIHSDGYEKTMITSQHNIHSRYTKLYKWYWTGDVHTFFHRKEQLYCVILHVGTLCRRTGHCIWERWICRKIKWQLLQVIIRNKTMFVSNLWNVFQKADFIWFW